MEVVVNVLMHDIHPLYCVHYNHSYTSLTFDQTMMVCLISPTEHLTLHTLIVCALLSLPDTYNSRGGGTIVVVYTDF